MPGIDVLRPVIHFVRPIVRSPRFERIMRSTGFERIARRIWQRARDQRFLYQRASIIRLIRSRPEAEIAVSIECSVSIGREPRV